MSRHRPLSLLCSAALACSLLQPVPAEACSRVFANASPQAMVVGRTMDLFLDDRVALALRPRGLQAGGLHGLQDPNPLRWRSRYGTAGALSLGIVMSDGLNERGLNANLLYLGTSRYPRRNTALPALSNARMAEYVLDNFATVEEAIAGLQRVQVVSDRLLNREWGLHLSLADPSGASAVVEFINGEMKVKRGTDSRVMTNEPGLNWQLANLRRYRPFGGSLPLPGDIDPPSRFVRASTYLSTLPKAATAAEAEAHVFGVMKNVAVPAGALDYSSGDSEDTWVTLWTTIANLSQGTYGIQLSSDPDPLWISLGQLRWNGPGMRVLPLRDLGRSGDISALLNQAPVQTKTAPDGAV
ncbi:MAG: linear amide C-N hydrolase [Cyanobium sp.]